MASSSTAVRHWQRIIARWPIDKVRPEAVSFQKLMGKRLERLQNPSSSVLANSVTSNKANVQPAPPPKLNEAKELKQANVLYALLEDRFAKQYKLQDSLRYPASNPEHYDAVIAESEAAPTRSVVSGFTNYLKGMIRFS